MNHQKFAVFCLIVVWFITCNNKSNYRNNNTMNFSVYRYCIPRHFVCVGTVWTITSTWMSTHQGSACLFRIGGNKLFHDFVVACWIL